MNNKEIIKRIFAYVGRYKILLALSIKLIGKLASFAT